VNRAILMIDAYSYPANLRMNYLKLSNESFGGLQWWDFRRGIINTKTVSDG